jgi:hypothetical protein
MSKWLKRALLLNLIFLVLFIVTQYITWTQLTITPEFGGAMVFSVTSNGIYQLATVGISMQGLLIQNGLLIPDQIESTYYVNYELIIFVIAIIVNLYLLRRIENEEKVPSLSSPKP